MNKSFQCGDKYIVLFFSDSATVYSENRDSVTGSQDIYRLPLDEDQYVMFANYANDTKDSVGEKTMEEALNFLLKDLKPLTFA